MKIFTTFIGKARGRLKKKNDGGMAEQQYFLMEDEHERQLCVTLSLAEVERIRAGLRMLYSARAGNFGAARWKPVKNFIKQEMDAIDTLSKRMIEISKFAEKYKE